MYHSVRDAAMSPGTHPYFETAVDPAVFRMQMSYLSSHDYRVVPLAEIESWLDRPDSGDGKTVVLTFDDGFRDFHSTAFPVLSAHNFPVSVFLPTGLIGRRADANDYLNWDEIRELHAQGVCFGSHTVNHPRLHGMPYQVIESEIRDSRREIEDRLGGRIDSIAYPHAFPQEDRRFTDRLKRILGESGYRYCLTTRIGRVTRKSPMPFLERIPVNSHDDTSLFRAKLEGGYDWLQTFQSARRRLFRLRHGNP